MEMRDRMYVNVQSSADSRSAVEEHSYEDLYENSEMDLQHHQNAAKLNKAHSADPQRRGRRRFLLAAVCLGLVCVLLLATIILLLFSFFTAQDHLQSRLLNVTTERDQLKIHQPQNEAELLQGIDEYLAKAKQHGWNLFQTSLYQINPSEKTWNESREDCRNRGADLVVINSVEEQEFLVKTLDNVRAWIGLSRRDSEASWRWVDGSELTTEYWNDGEPNGHQSMEHCGEFRGIPVKNNWNDRHCSYKGPWVCEKSIF